MHVRLTKDFTFEAAQTLPNVPADHKCGRMHGHSFKVEISVEGETDPATGWLYDHSRISRAMDPLLEQLDHSYLNDIAGLENPTIETMCRWFWERLTPQLAGLAEIVSRYATAPASGKKWETHRLHGDIQFMVSGSELIGYAPRASLSIRTPYNGEKDAEFYEPPSGEVTRFALEEGSFAVFLPQDGHQPGVMLGSVSEVHKVVIKFRL